MVTPDTGGRQSAKAPGEPAQEFTASETGQPPARSLAQLESSQKAIRDATKWLVAATGAVGAVLVAGLQLRDLPHGSLATLVALAGVSAALLAVAIILYRAADVLSAGYTTFGSIVDLARDDKYKRQRTREEWWAERIKPREDKLDQPEENPSKRLYKKAWRIIRRSPAVAVVDVMKVAQKATTRIAKVQDIRIDQLISYLNVDTFYFTQGLAGNINDLHQALLETDEEILSIRGVKVGGTQAAGKIIGTEDPTQVRKNQALLEKADWRQDRLESAMGVLIAFANQRVLEGKFRKLILAILFGGAVVAIGAGAFAVAPKIGKPQALSVTQPTRIAIRVVGNGLGKFCPPGTLLQGVAVGGTWQEPIVVTEGVGNCPAQQVRLNPDQAIAVPVLPSP